MFFSSACGVHQGATQSMTRQSVPAPANIVILTGAGLSAESGIPTFRDANGIWAKVDYREVATPEGFEKNPDRVHAFYNMRRKAHQQAKPNAAHDALAKLEDQHPAAVTIITQNVDVLHEAAGTRNVIHMHGEATKVSCMDCQSRQHWLDDLSTETTCPQCHRKGRLRPDVVWFGELPYHMDRISDLLSTADLFLSIGTSGNVYPAAGFVAQAHANGAKTVELNLEETPGAAFFQETIHGRATEIVPTYIDRLLREVRDL
jgi:NAD-dependent protein deacetylase/lipoamidase